MTKHQTFVIQALEARRSDDLFRARRRFQNHTPAQMAGQYGESGRTCAEILKEYEEHEAAIDAAIAWVMQRDEPAPQSLAQKLRDAASMAGYYGEPFGCALMAQAADEIERQAGQYKIVIEERSDLLEKAVQQCMNEGWLPLGGASVCVTSDGRGGDSWLHQQAMTR